MLGLSYHLRQGVKVIFSKERWFLVSRSPLKALVLNPRLGPVLAKAVERERLDPMEIAAGMGKDQAERLDRYLYQLVKRGFLDEAPDRLTSNPQALPKVSVIIPVRNRPHDLERCLASLKQMAYPAGLLEMMVVDDASRDETPEVAKSYGVTTIINKRRQGASRCRNLAAARAGGEVLCFVDSDCTVHPDWLAELVRVLEDPAVTACGGLVDSFFTHDSLGRYEQVMSSLRMGERPKDSRLSDSFFYLPSCNLCVRTNDFLKQGGFNENMEVGEDVDLCWRIIDSGGVIEYRPAAVVRHRHRNQIGPFCRRRFDYGTSEPLLQSIHPSRKKRIPLRPLLLLFWGSLVASLTLHPAFGALAAAGLLAGAWRRKEKADKAGLRLSWPLALGAAFRVQLSGAQELASFASRYYLLPAAVFAPLIPMTAATLWAAHLAVGLERFIIKKPRLNPLRFLFFFSLEQLSYQLGVWTQCMKMVFFRPVFPRPAWPGVREVWRFFKKVIDREPRGAAGNNSV